MSAGDGGWRPMTVLLPSPAVADMPSSAGEDGTDGTVDNTVYRDLRPIQET